MVGVTSKTETESGLDGLMGAFLILTSIRIMKTVHDLIEKYYRTYKS